MTALVDLPTDILYIIFPYLNATDFLALTSCTKSLHTYCQDPNFWRSHTRTTFRIPSQPLLQADGARWQWLYRRLRTQTQLPRNESTEDLDANNRNIGWPKKVEFADISAQIGIIADVQCGGRGGLRAPAAPRLLTFPSAYPLTTKDRYEPSTAISHFSTGRELVLALADDGKVWQWNNDVARLVKPLHVDVGEKNVSRVVAGWDRASMFVNGRGIVYWPLDPSIRTGNAEADAVLIDTATIPGTSFAHSRYAQEIPDTLEARIGQVVNHIALEKYIVFITSLNKVFFYQAIFPLPDLDPPTPIELTTFYPSTSDVAFRIHDIQGSFRSFAIFTTSGVLKGNREMIEAVQSGTFDPSSTDPSHPLPTMIPALQNIPVTSVAFGDYHSQVLRSDGTIVAYGVDPQNCGAMGLGLPGGTGALRGVLAGFSDGQLGHNVGRQVWFDHCMHRWLGDMKEKAVTDGEGKPRGDMIFPRVTSPRETVAAATTAVGDYFEREGKKWEDGIVEEGGMGSYFVLKVAAAGWHSAALVLVDEEQAERARQKHIVPRKREATLDHDHHEGTWEDIDAPWDQMSKTLDWLWGVVRGFLGLQARDRRLEAERKEPEEEPEEHDEGETRYTWSDLPFPRLRMANGQVMPGEIEVME
ncbi:MAG: hypothetical protein Q9223_000452 [Gallowayella weberi]